MMYLLFALLAPFCVALDKSHETKEFIELDRVDSLTVSGGYYITLSQGKPGITLTGDKDAINSLKIDSSSHEVRLSTKTKKKSFLGFGGKNYSSDYYNLGIHITLPRLDSIHLYGTASATLKEDLSIEKIELSGASKLDIRTPVTPRNLDIEIRGAAFLSAKSIKTNQLMIQQFGSSRAVFSDIKAREYAISNISGRSAMEAIMINANQLKLEGSGSSLYNLNTIKTDELTVELYGVTAANVHSIKADTVYTFLHGSSSLTARNSELKSHYEHNTGIAVTQYGKLIEK